MKYLLEIVLGGARVVGAMNVKVFVLAGQSNMEGHGVAPEQC